MRIGIVSDPHGCLVGLEACLDWLDKAGVDRIVCAGDVANFGPQPNEVISLLAERGIATVQGNSDYDLLHPPPAQVSFVDRGEERLAQLAAINAWGREQLTSASREWLAALPLQLRPAPGVLVVHGGLNDSREIVDAEAQPNLPPGISAVAAGHLHTPFIIRTEGGIWVNAGSTGGPTDGDPRAALAVLESRPQGWTASIQRVPFDLQASARAIRQAKMPYAGRLIETQRLARWW